MKSTQLQDKILSAIMDNTNYTLFELGQALNRLRSFDKLLSCIDKATQEKKSLSAMVDVMLEGNSN